MNQHTDGGTVQEASVPDARSTVTLSDFRIYGQEECGKDGYPHAWHETIKHTVRDEAGNRCVRCGHPYEKGMGEWSACDTLCTHEDTDGSIHALWDINRGGGAYRPEPGQNVDIWRRQCLARGMVVQARWRILTVHHLNGVKADCRWWNLTSLCQRCHLRVQRVVVMGRVYPWEHSEWFKPYAAGWYAHAYLGEDITPAEAVARLDELLALERVA